MAMFSAAMDMLRSTSKVSIMPGNTVRLRRSVNST